MSLQIVRTTILLLVGSALVGAFFWQYTADKKTARGMGHSTTNAAVYQENNETPANEDNDIRVGHEDRYSLQALRNWERPAGPPKVGLQVGHLENDQTPEELADLAENGPGAVWNKLSEREVVQAIVQEAAARLREDGIVVDILPATVPSGYVADAFVSVHADGNDDPAVRGFKAAHFSADYSGRSQYLEQYIKESYKEATNLPEDENITYYMTGYYAFNWWRYEHAVHPMTPAVILETGFLTNAQDREIIVNDPQQAAAGIASGIRRYLNKDSNRMATRRDIQIPMPPFVGQYQCLEGELDPNDDPAELDGCRPGIIITSEPHSQADASGDEEDNNRIGLLFADSATSSALANISDGESIRVDGAFTPMVEERNLSWYNYNVRGTLAVTDITTTTRKYGR